MVSSEILAPALSAEGEGGYGESTPTLGNWPTGDRNVDALIHDRRWQSSTVTYSFPDDFSDDYEEELGYAQAGVHQASFEPLNSAQKQATRSILTRFYAGVAQLQFEELRGGQDRHATLRLAQSSDPPTAYAYLPDDFFESGDIWFNPTDYDRPRIGSYAYHTLIHEIGHSLGLDHGHDPQGVTQPPLSTDRDSMEFSVMTYRAYTGHQDWALGYPNEAGGFAQSLMMLDIAALQTLYGANYSHQAEATTYQFSTTTGEMFINGVGQGKPLTNRIFRTIWDGNGRDTYDLSNYSTPTSINLAPGSWSRFDQQGNRQLARLDSRPGQVVEAQGHVFNALLHKGDRRSLIENALGGSADDVIRGNGANNKLQGRAGNDQLLGRQGADVLQGGSGADQLVGGAGNDRLVGGTQADRLNGTDDQARGRGEIDRLRGGSGADQFDLGGNGGVYYLDEGGPQGFAIIQDLELEGADADRLQVAGRVENYRVQDNVVRQGISGFGLFYQTPSQADLIALLQGRNLSAAGILQALA
ncbi:M10 family metallopeptidase [Lyngbya confervoides]|uniref:M10 family metallopeptidase C-terminal domain-containing protein n=1 Tax=Lyngbya confervoides BDU141951 TaxID=1574623 RepID=A0ABD4T0S1_9CYAN|nr:M10 family metallopeptidase [Lyngbya confervoides]MCM1982020.1 M10 family metallopeptidase C-terminal domain-containing protein [Lyngbya confervoides BDU141951]